MLELSFLHDELGDTKGEGWPYDEPIECDSAPGSVYIQTDEPWSGESFFHPAKSEIEWHLSDTVTV